MRGNQQESNHFEVERHPHPWCWHSVPGSIPLQVGKYFEVIRAFVGSKEPQKPKKGEGWGVAMCAPRHSYPFYQTSTARVLLYSFDYEPGYTLGIKHTYAC